MIPLRWIPVNVLLVTYIFFRRRSLWDSSSQQQRSSNIILNFFQLVINSYQNLEALDTINTILYLLGGAHFSIYTTIYSICSSHICLYGWYKYQPHENWGWNLSSLFRPGCHSNPQAWTHKPGVMYRLSKWFRPITPTSSESNLLSMHLILKNSN